MSGYGAGTPGRRMGFGVAVKVLAPVALAVASMLAACAGPAPDNDTGAALPPFPAPSRSAAPSVDPAEFTGAGACESCHPDQYGAWRSSVHGRAGGEPGPATVIAPFGGAPIRFADAVVVPVVDGGRYLFRVTWRDTTTVWAVDGVVGRGHMVGGGTQGFLHRNDDGTVRFLPFDYSATDRRWFCNTGTRSDEGWVPITRTMRLADCGDWPPRRVMGTLARFSNCQECHGSQIRAAFDSTSRAYRTDWTTLAVNCESCHGPGRTHVERMRDGEQGPDIGLRSLATLDTDASLQVCFRCHALKDVVRTGYLPGPGLAGFYAIKFPILGDRPYRPDGRVRTFAYQATHLYSACYYAGSMRCVDCHEPHGKGYRDIHGATLQGRFDDGQCLDCHPSKADRVEAHTHHPADSPGSRCVACHMPYLQQPELGDAVTYARADHTIPVPRPGEDERQGVPSACASCHRDRPVDALRDTTRVWWGDLKPRPPLIAAQLQGAGTAEALLQPGPAMARFAGLATFLERVLAPDMDRMDAGTRHRLEALSRDPDLDVRALALAALHYARGGDPEVRRLLVTALRDAAPDDRALRGRWVLALGYLADRLREAERYAEARSVYRKALDIAPGDARVLEALALAQREGGDPATAAATLRRALAAEPDLPLARVNLAIALQQAGDVDAAARVLQEAIQRDPGEPMAYFTLGNLFLRMDRPADAGRFYARAVELDPSLVQAQVYLARSRILTGDYDGARDAAEMALEFDPAQATARQMLADLRRPGQER